MKEGAVIEAAGHYPEQAHLDFVCSPDSVIICLSGNWTLAFPLPPADLAEREIGKNSSVRLVAFDTENLKNWDTSLVAFLSDVARICAGRQIELRSDRLPRGVQRLLALATAVPENRNQVRDYERTPLITRVQGFLLGSWQSALEGLTFLGDVATAFFRMCAGRKRFRRQDLLRLIQHCGAEAVPIVSLISLLVGLILAFVGSIQLEVFGAQIYVADLVGVAMVRAMGAIMAGIIMAGRTGASFAAQIGTMQVNEEIDALKTASISPIDFLVLPEHWFCTRAHDAPSHPLCRSHGDNRRVGRGLLRVST